MTDIAVRPAYISSIEYEDEIEDGAFNFVEQVNNRTSRDAVQLPGVAVPSYALDRGSEQALFESAVEWLEDNGYVKNRDLVIFGHGTVEFGFGSSFRIYVNGKQVCGGVCYADYFASSLLAEVFAMHELAHTPFGAEHYDGSVETNSNNEITSVSPMAAAYTKANNGNCDTEVCGSLSSLACGGDSPPPSFCDNGVDEYDNGTADGFENCPIHTTTLSECTISKINSSNYTSPR